MLIRHVHSLRGCNNCTLPEYNAVKKAEALMLGEDLKLPTEHVSLDRHLSVGDMYLFAFSKTRILPAIAVTANKTYKHGLRPFLTLPIKEVETVALQLLKAPHANSLCQHYMYYLCRRPQSLVYKMIVISGVLSDTK